MTYLLTFIYCGKIEQVMKSTDVRLIQHKRSQLIKSNPKYKKCYQVRTEEGFKAKPIL